MAKMANPSRGNKNPMGKSFKKALKGQLKEAVKKGTKVQSVKKPGKFAKASKAKPQQGTSNKKALTKKASTDRGTKQNFGYTDYFNTDGNPLGGFKGFTTGKKGY